MSIRDNDANYGNVPRTLDLSYDTISIFHKVLVGETIVVIPGIVLVVEIRFDLPRRLLERA